MYYINSSNLPTKLTLSKVEEFQKSGKPSLLCEYTLPKKDNSYAYDLNQAAKKQNIDLQIPEINRLGKKEVFTIAIEDSKTMESNAKIIINNYNKELAKPYFSTSVEEGKLHAIFNCVSWLQTINYFNDAHAGVKANKLLNHLLKENNLEACDLKEKDCFGIKYIADKNLAVYYEIEKTSNVSIENTTATGVSSKLTKSSGEKTVTQKTPISKLSFPRIM